MITQDLLQALERENISFLAEASLREYHSFHVACKAALIVMPKSVGQLCAAISLLDGAEVPTVLLGKGSNVLFAKSYYEGAVLLTTEVKGISITWIGEEEALVHCPCGSGLTPLSAKVAEEGLSGLEFAFGIPGTVGGAIFMNAGAYGGQISDVLLRSIAYDRKTKNVFTVTEHGFGYRHSIYMERPELICLEAVFSLKKGNVEHIHETMRELARSRRDKQPLEYPSAGSYFKRPEGYFAGKLIEECGLKGTRIGDAQVSEKHAGFLINRANATAEDILALEKLVSRRVWEEKSVLLEREVRVIES